ncbi:MAG: sensor histidine kinase N-terminal domain-containing protein [Dokdonella sp.]
MKPSPDRAPSVRHRLLRFLLAPLALMLGIGIFVDYQSGALPIHRAYDQVLREATLAIAAHLRNEDGTIVADLPPQAIDVLRSDSRDAIYYIVRGPHGELISGDPDLPIGDPDAATPSFQDALYHGQPIRIAAYTAPVGTAKVTIAVAETLHKRTRAAHRILVGIVLSDGLQLIGTLVLIWLGVRYGVRPLRALSAQISARSARELAPLDQATVPSEVRPLVQAFNGLLESAGLAALAQQQFLANAAHQLRTPLAGIIAQLDLLAHDPDAGMIRDRVVVLHEGTRRLAHIANQLLALARAEPSANLAHDFHRVDLAALVAEIVSQHLDRSLLVQIDLGAEAEAASVQGSAWLLRELLTNLVDNALQYTPTGGCITVRCGSSERGAFLEVEDDGPGIDESERMHIHERFYRVPGSPGGGCGLGLAIVDEIARVHDARLTISAAAGAHGTLARVDFPLR